MVHFRVVWRVPSIGGLIIWATILCPSVSNAADFFRWVDERGVVHFTDNPYNIPEKQKAAATKIKGRVTPQSPTPPPQDKASIPFQKKGAVVIVPGLLNEKARANFVVDTGASYTMISSAMAKELDIDLSKTPATVPFQTANGTVTAPLVTLESIEIGGFKVTGLAVAVHDIFPDSHVTGLLGLNFLSHFRMDIDTQNGVLTLEKR